MNQKYLFQAIKRKDLYSFSDRLFFNNIPYIASNHFRLYSIFQEPSSWKLVMAGSRKSTGLQAVESHQQTVYLQESPFIYKVCWR